MPIRSMIVIAASLTLAMTPSLAAAQVKNPSPGAQVSSLTDIEQRLTADGFRVLEIERYPNSIEVKGFDQSGLCVEMRLDPRTGDVLRRERDDDCGRSSGHDDDGRRGRH